MQISQSTADVNYFLIKDDGHLSSWNCCIIILHTKKKAYAIGHVLLRNFCKSDEYF